MENSGDYIQIEEEVMRMKLMIMMTIKNIMGRKSIMMMRKKLPPNSFKIPMNNRMKALTIETINIT